MVTALPGIYSLNDHHHRTQLFQHYPNSMVNCVTLQRPTQGEIYRRPMNLPSNSQWNSSHPQIQIAHLELFTFPFSDRSIDEWRQWWLWILIFHQHQLFSLVNKLEDHYHGLMHELYWIREGHLKAFWSSEFLKWSLQQ